MASAAAGLRAPFALVEPLSRRPRGRAAPPAHEGVVAGDGLFTCEGYTLARLTRVSGANYRKL